METTLQHLYEQVCRQENMTRQQTHCAVLRLVEALLSGTFLPDLRGLRGNTLRRGAYLLDVFLRLYSMKQSQTRQLSAQLEKARKILQRFPPDSRIPFYLNDTPGRDQLAHLWGLSNGIRPASIPGLLDLQRRAYNATAVNTLLAIVLF